MVIPVCWDSKLKIEIEVVSWFYTTLLAAPFANLSSPGKYHKGLAAAMTFSVGYFLSLQTWVGQTQKRHRGNPANIKISNNWYVRKVSWKDAELKFLLFVTNLFPKNTFEGAFLQGISWKVGCTIHSFQLFVGNRCGTPNKRVAILRNNLKHVICFPLGHRWGSWASVATQRVVNESTLFDLLQSLPQRKHRWITWLLLNRLKGEEGWNIVFKRCQVLYYIYIHL